MCGIFGCRSQYQNHATSTHEDGCLECTTGFVFQILSTKSYGAAQELLVDDQPLVSGNRMVSVYVRILANMQKCCIQNCWMCPNGQAHSSKAFCDARQQHINLNRSCKALEPTQTICICDVEKAWFSRGTHRGHSQIPPNAHGDSYGTFVGTSNGLFFLICVLLLFQLSVFWPIRVSFAFHSRSIHIPSALHLRSFGILGTQYVLFVEGSRKVRKWNLAGSRIRFIPGLIPE